VERLHERGIEVIAPRVEDTRTAALLWMSRIDYIQGNLVQLAGRSLDFDFNAAVL
jgi:EAL domain-containing protein (putative c-di-GMP-specific phosphodiesterase class I)